MACCGNNNVERKKWTDGATDRINRLRDQFFRNKPELDVFRALVYTRVYQETEAEDLPIRHAKALLAYMTEKLSLIHILSFSDIILSPFWKRGGFAAPFKTCCGLLRYSFA